MENILIILVFFIVSLILFKVTLKEYKNNTEEHLKYIHLVGVACSVLMVILLSIGLIDKLVKFFIENRI